MNGLGHPEGTGLEFWGTSHQSTMHQAPAEWFRHPHESLGTREAGKRPAHGGPVTEVQEALRLYRRGLRLRTP